jgi:hypothetical protein
MREPVDLELVDETDDLIEFVASCYSDKGDIGTVLFLDLCDRRGFTSANRSPRRPEPEHHVLTAQRIEIEFTAICSRHHHHFDVRSRVGRGCRSCCSFGNGCVITARPARRQHQSNGRNQSHRSSPRTHGWKLNRNNAMQRRKYIRHIVVFHAWTIPTSEPGRTTTMIKNPSSIKSPSSRGAI